MLGDWITTEIAGYMKAMLTPNVNYFEPIPLTHVDTERTSVMQNRMQNYLAGIKGFL